MEDAILKYALHNAVKHGGKAVQGAVVGQIINEFPDAKSRMKEIAVQISRTIKEVNKMSAAQQKANLEKIAPELLEKKERKERDMFAFLKLEGDIITAFPPEPSKYPHIGHAKALFANHELARAYDGRFKLRFEDTNPSLVKKEFYDIHIDNYRWLGVGWDELDYASDHMEDYYLYAHQLIQSGDAYMCDCTIDDIRDKRFKGEPCSCRTRDMEHNMRLWTDFFKADEGSMILRMKIHMEHKNTTMRDPAIMRIMDAEHPRKAKEYRVWPTYDFQNSIMDGLGGITIRLRSKEFEMRSELQDYIQKKLGFAATRTYEFARFNLKGVESSGRVIREKVNSGELIGWDDPSLTTIVALRRRGFQAKAIKDFVLSTGFTKSESVLTWDDLIVHNKRLLDKEADRYFFVSDPVEITIEGAPEQSVQLKKHPDEDRGYRNLDTNDKFFVERADFESIEDGLYRLMDCLNFRKEGHRLVFDSLEHEKFKKQGKKIMHWLPAGLTISAEVLMPDKSIKAGLAETTTSEISVGQVVQFERFGFVRFDEDGRFWFTHD